MIDTVGLVEAGVNVVGNTNITRQRRLRGLRRFCVSAGQGCRDGQGPRAHADGLVGHDRCSNWLPGRRKWIK